MLLALAGLLAGLAVGLLAGLVVSRSGPAHGAAWRRDPWASLASRVGASTAGSAPVGARLLAAVAGAMERLPILWLVGSTRRAPGASRPPARAWGARGIARGGIVDAGQMRCTVPAVSAGYATAGADRVWVAQRRYGFDQPTAVRLAFLQWLIETQRLNDDGATAAQDAER